jgi:hypothetical protein
MTLLPTRVEMPALTGVRNLPFLPSQAFDLEYKAVELRPEDYTVGVRLVSATLTVAPEFGQPATLTKTVTTTLVVGTGQVVDNADATGVGELFIVVTGAECSGWTERQVFVVKVLDWLGRSTTYDAGYLVPVTGHEDDFAMVGRVIVAPTELTLNMGATSRIAVVPVDEEGVALPDRIITRTSLDTSIATVDSYGRVSAIGVGMTSIVASVDGVESTVMVTVPLADVSDTFTRRDGPIGTAETGQVWQPINGNWLVTNHHAFHQGTAGTADKRVCVIDTLYSDGAVSVVAAAIGVYGTRLVVRLTDVDNYLFVEWAATTVRLVKREAFVDANLAPPVSYTMLAGDQVRVILSGPSVEVEINGVSMIGPVTEPFNEDATMHGLGAYDTAAGEFDNFLMEV